MPYRRLPNTDAARIRALETALNNEEFSNINNLPFSLHLRQKIEFFLPKFKTAITNSQCARDKQNVNSRKSKIIHFSFPASTEFYNCPGRIKTNGKNFLRN